MLLSILREENNVAAQILSRFGVTYDVVRAELEQKEEGSGPRMSVESPESGDMSNPSERSRKATKSKTPVLDNFGRDLTKAAEENKLDPIVGREKEIERDAQILSRRMKNCPVLIGEHGVG